MIFSVRCSPHVTRRPPSSHNRAVRSPSIDSGCQWRRISSLLRRDNLFPQPLGAAGGLLIQQVRPNADTTLDGDLMLDVVASTELRRVGQLSIGKCTAGLAQPLILSFNVLCPRTVSHAAAVAR
jgi:hypothetical protein